MILYIENPKDATRKFIELTNEYSKIFTILSALYLGFLAARHMESYLPDQGLNPHPLHWKV